MRKPRYVIHENPVGVLWLHAGDTDYPLDAPDISWLLKHLQKAADDNFMDINRRTR